MKAFDVSWVTSSDIGIIMIVYSYFLVRILIKGIRSMFEDDPIHKGMMKREMIINIIYALIFTGFLTLLVFIINSVD
jgi:hypothetical protein